MNKWGLAIIFFIILFNVGCRVTISLKESNENYSDMVREFKENRNLLRGVYVGQKIMKSNAYYHLQFSDVFKGESRYLDLYIPVDQKKKISPMFYETNEALQGEEAFLVLKFAGWESTSHYVYELLNDPSALYYYLPKLHININDKQKTLIVLALSRGYSDDITYNKDDYYTSIIVHYAVWNRRDNGEFVWNAKSTSRRRRHFDPLKLSWDERSRFVYIVRQLGYVGTIPVDILFFPYYFVENLGKGLAAMALSR